MLYKRPLIPLFLAILFHISGVIGILYTPYKDWFINNTPITLVLMSFLLAASQERIEKGFIGFFILAFATGMITEMIGVNTGILFGSYQYGTVMGPKLLGVPFLIGINWFVIVFCCGSLMQQLNKVMLVKYEAPVPRAIIKWSVVIDGAVMATFFDWLMEPVAIKLGFWAWEGGNIPMLNYACWFVISALLLAIQQQLKIKAQNHFAIHLLIIQALFFLSLRIFL
jgi:putative membrane protein